SDLFQIAACGLQRLKIGLIKVYCLDAISKFQALGSQIAPASAQIGNIAEDDLFHMRHEQGGSLVDHAMREHAGFGPEYIIDIGGKRLQGGDEIAGEVGRSSQPENHRMVLRHAVADFGNIADPFAKTVNTELLVTGHGYPSARFNTLQKLCKPCLIASAMFSEQE